MSIENLLLTILFFFPEINVYDTKTQKMKVHICGFGYYLIKCFFESLL